jgi:hypothetical protein
VLTEETLAADPVGEEGRPVGVRPTAGWLAGLGAVLLIGVLAYGTTMVVAVFSSGRGSANNQFVSGSTNLSVSPGSAIASMSSMMPGDSVTTAVTVANTGTTTLRYAVKSTTTENVLAAQLTLTVKSGVANCDNAGFGSSGSVLYGPAALGSTAGTNVVGSPAQGAQAGDRVLAGGTNEILCVQVSLPSGTGGSYLGLTTSATFDFQAEQTASNP